MLIEEKEKNEIPGIALQFPVSAGIANSAKTLLKYTSHVFFFSKVFFFQFSSFKVHKVFFCAKNLH